MELLFLIIPVTGVPEYKLDPTGILNAVLSEFKSTTPPPTLVVAIS
jgi:hypothetical protein